MNHQKASRLKPLLDTVPPGFMVDTPRLKARGINPKSVYVITAIKDNQPTILEDLKEIDWSEAPWFETVDKGHGRLERRRCAAIDVSGAEWDGFVDLHGRRQAIRIERERERLKDGKRSAEVTWCLTSLDADRAGPEELLRLVREHWIAARGGERRPRTR